MTGRCFPSTERMGAQATRLVEHRPRGYWQRRRAAGLFFGREGSMDGMTSDHFLELKDAAGRVDPTTSPERAAARIFNLCDAMQLMSCDRRANFLAIAAI